MRLIKQKEEGNEWLKQENDSKQNNSRKFRSRNFMLKKLDDKLIANSIANKIDANKWVVFSRIIVWVVRPETRCDSDQEVNLAAADFGGTRLIIKAFRATDSPPSVSV